MAKRRRLTPASDGYRDDMADAAQGVAAKSALISPFGPDGASRPAPIARIAADAATTAAFDAVSDELRHARVEGRLVQALSLDAVVENYLVRDRIAVNDDDLEALMESLRARGQQSPVEVVDLGAGHYGLISGWRRLTALRRLLAETEDPRFGSILALLRRPAEASDAYVAMIEENEIRVGLSYYERARIVAKSVEQGVFATRKQALQTLFSRASRAKRSKIGSFLTIVATLDPVLRHPARLGERTGLALAQALEADPGLGPRLARHLEGHPVANAEEELVILAEAAKRPRGALAARRSAFPVAVDELAGVRVHSATDPSGLRITLSGPNVDVGLRDRLVAWLRRAGTGGVQS